jgi:DNA-directed RNA polymerase II subunit RPB2
LMAKEYMCKYVNMMGYDRDKSEKERRMTYLVDILQNDFLPHVGSSNKVKAYFLGHMVKQLLDVYLQKRDQDDRDSYVNKRIDTAGVLMANLFRQYFTKLVKDMKTNINKEFTSGSWKAMRDFEQLINATNINKIIKHATITTGLKYALATGNWGIKNNSSNKQGIAQVLSRLTYNSTLSHLRRINTPMEKTSKLVAPRKLHSTQMMYMCGAETPEGASVGVVKNMALSCHITGYADVQPVVDILRNDDVELLSELDTDELFGKTQIFINGNWMYVTQKPKKIVDLLIHLRRTGVLHVHTSVVWRITDNRIEVYTDAGRCTRPLYILDSFGTYRISNDIVRDIEISKLKWNDLLAGTVQGHHYGNMSIKEGIVEFMDVQEQENAMISITDSRLQENGTKAITYKYTHAEIHPSFIQGVLASIIPFSDHNQSPRNCYQSSMGKQAMGIYATNFRYRMDTVAHVLQYPQLPLVYSRVIKYLPSNEMPSGINVVVAIASFTGYNQEDSVIMNKSACERGLFVSDHYHTYKDEEKKRQSTSIKMQEKFTKPNSNNTLGTRGNNYNYLNAEGFPAENIYVKQNDAIIGKIHPVHSKTDDTEMYRCCSTVINEGEEGFVDKVMVSRNGDGYRFVKVRIRSSRTPTVGDKHACYSPDHDVYTSTRGWIPINQIERWDSVMSIDPVSKEIVHQQPTDIQQYDFAGGMYQICNGDGVDLLVTPNHRMWVDCNDGQGFRIVLAEQLPELVQRHRICFENIQHQISFVRPEHIQRVPYSGTVHCCTVPCGLLYVRRRRTLDSGVICGNSRHGQKGTVGIIYRQEDMPFTKHGITPDIIMNPHAVPSRMTIAQVIECLMGKVGVNIGMFGDATVFTQFNETKLGDLLEKLGFQRNCDEVMYNGRTGEQLKVPIFIGPTYYQRLKHMVEDKMHSRSTGPNVILTRQPVEGRSRDGGLRFGKQIAKV